MADDEVNKNRDAAGKATESGTTSVKKDKDAKKDAERQVRLQAELTKLEGNVTFTTSFPTIGPARGKLAATYFHRVLCKDPSLKTFQVWKQEGFDFIEGDLQAMLQHSLITGTVGRIGTEYALGTLLHDPVVRLPLQFPVGTLFYFAFTNPAHEPLQVQKVADSSARLRTTWEGVDYQGARVHVADVHQDAVLTPAQHTYLRERPASELTVENAEKWVVKEFWTQPRVAVKHFEFDAREAYWQRVNEEHYAIPPVLPFTEIRDKALIKKEFQRGNLISFHNYCMKLDRVANALWTKQHAAQDVASAMPDDANAKQDHANAQPDPAEIFSLIQQVAYHVKVTGIIPFPIAENFEYNLLEILAHWMTHASSSRSTMEDEQHRYRAYTERVYDLFQWAGDHGLFYFSCLEGDQDALMQIAIREGIKLPKKTPYQDPFNRNPLIHVRSPFAFISNKSVKDSEDADPLLPAKKFILYRRLAALFALLKGLGRNKLKWDGIASTGTNELARTLRETLANDQETGEGSPFAWVTDPAQLPKKYVAAFRHLGYRYFLNYVGGMLGRIPVFFETGYYPGEEVEVEEQGVTKRVPKLDRYTQEHVHPFDRMRLYMETLYLLSLYYSWPASLANRNVSTIIDTVMPALVGANVTQAIADAVAHVESDFNQKRKTKTEKLTQQAEQTESLDEIAPVAEEGELEGKSGEKEEPDAQEKIKPRKSSKKAFLRMKDEKKWFSFLVEMYRAIVQGAQDQTPAKYFEQLQRSQSLFAAFYRNDVIRTSMFANLQRIYTLRFFYRSHFVPLSPVLQDFLPSDMLTRAIGEPCKINDATFQHLVGLEVAAKRWAGRVTGGSKRIVRPIVPAEVRAKLQEAMTLPETQTFAPMLPYAAKRVAKRRIGNYIYNCEMLAARLAAGGKREVLAGGRRDVDQIAKLAAIYRENHEKQLKRRNEVLKALGDYIPRDFSALARFASSGQVVPGTIKQMLEEAEGCEGVPRSTVKSLARMLRNRLDGSKSEKTAEAGQEPDSEEGEAKESKPGTKDGGDGAPVDTSSNYQYFLGQRYNRLQWGKRLQRLSSTLAGGLVDNIQKRIVQWAKSQRLLLYFQSPALVESLRIFEDNWGSDAQELASNLPQEVRDLINGVARQYPILPALGTTKRPPGAGEKGAEKGAESTAGGKNPASNALTLDDLLLAIMKSLVITAEQEGDHAKVADNTKIKLVKMIYAHEFLCKQSDAFAADNHLPARDLGFILTVPGFVPDFKLARTLGWAVSELVNSAVVSQPSMATPVPHRPESRARQYTCWDAEAFRTDYFKTERTNFADAVGEVLASVATMLVDCEEKSFEKTAPIFVKGVAAAWGKRNDMLAAWNNGKLDRKDLFAPFLSEIQERFEKAVTGVLKNLGDGEEEEEGRTREPAPSQIKPFPLFLSKEQPTVAAIDGFSAIQGDIISGTGKTFQVEVQEGTGTKTLTASATPGAIPFVINSAPLTREDIKNYDAFFGGPDKNPLLPEVDFEIADIVEYEPPARDRWKSRYTTKREKVIKDRKTLLNEMHELREYRTALANVLRSRRAVVDVALKNGLFQSSPSSASAIFTVIARELTKLKLEALGPQEQDALAKFTSAGKSAKQPKDVKKHVNKVISLGSAENDGVAARIYLEQNEDRLSALLRVPIITWGTQVNGASKSPAQQNVAAKRRANQLYDLIQRDLADKGWRVREGARARDFCTKRLACLSRDDNEEQEGKKIPFEMPARVTGPWNQDRATRRKSFQDSLAYLESQDWFRSYIHAGTFPSEVCVDRGLLEKIKGGATISGLMLLPPRYPSRNVHANVYLIGPANVMRKAPCFVVILLKGKHDRDPVLVLCIDVNRLNCPRTFMFRLRKMVSPGSIHVPLDRDLNDPKSRGEEISLGDWANLTGVFCYADRMKKVPGEANEEKKFPVTKGVHAYVGRSKGGGTREVNVGQDFFTKVCRAVFPPDGTERSRPTREQPYDVEAKKEPLDFSDKLGALMAYWGMKHAHTERHKIACIRKLRRVQGNAKQAKKSRDKAQENAKKGGDAAVQEAKKTGDKEYAKWRGKSLRLLSEIYNLNRRSKSIREADVDFLARVLLYMIVRFNVGRVAHEALHLTAAGTGGDGLGAVVQSMVKDFSPIAHRVQRFVQLVRREEFELPPFDATDAHYTSQYCFPCHAKGIDCTMDRAASYDFAAGDTCGRVDDVHGNASDNTGDRMIRRTFREDAKKAEKEEEGEEDDTEEEDNSRKTTNRLGAGT